MDNAPYHSVKKEKSPTSSSRKADIIKWLEDKGEVVDNTMVIPELLDIVKRIKPLHNKYVIDELAKATNKTILRLPPYHCELNPIELAWSSVKNHTIVLRLPPYHCELNLKELARSWIKNYVRMKNTTFKLNDVHDLLKKAVDNVTSQMWTNFVGHVIKEEDRFWKIDFLSDEVFDVEPETGKHVLTITGQTTSDSDDEDI
ncbi:uncharacterized protein LOC126551127 [Aphis gossypii]|uniref:uncharacterized protein LOC126551127 n=1 Tax=Aphis gossypii TaxID=80765 RepID=UPI00215917A8|nr:uncharacterized protein LOC126551127 [Aphis gossypii]